MSCDRLKRSAKSIQFIQKHLANDYALGLLSVVFLSVILRFWQLSRFNALVFDEVYFVKFAQAYLTGAPEFDAHPPLGKYLIAAGVWLGNRAAALFPDWQPQLTSAVGIAPFSYRWMNALVGSCIPPLVFGLSYTLSRHQRHSQRLTFATLAGVFVAVDGLFVVESRYALINVYMVFFGFLGHYLWLRAEAIASHTARAAPQLGLYRLLAGVALGGAIATKWNGLGFIFSLTIYALCQPKKHPIQLFIYLVLLPALTYSLLWLPHLQLTGENLTSLHATLLAFHQQLSTDGHPACTKWYAWPILLKPITYWYQDSGGQVFTVNNLGNPPLWWLSSASVLLLSIEKTRQLKEKFYLNRTHSTQLFAHKRDSAMITYLLAGYAANWLPWIAVSRCTFIYLYMPAAAFSFVTLAWLMSQWLQSSEGGIKVVGVGMLGAIAIAFIYWLPISLGSPLTPESLKIRWWLSTWI